VATYRTEQFRNVYTFPEVCFQNSYEELFIDCLADDSGFYRLSTLESYIYHMGNTLDDVSFTHKNSEKSKVSIKTFNQIVHIKKSARWVWLLNRSIGRMFVKLKWNR